MDVIHKFLPVSAVGSSRVHYRRMLTRLLNRNGSELWAGFSFRKDTGGSFKVSDETRTTRNVKLFVHTGTPVYVLFIIRGSFVNGKIIKFSVLAPCKLFG